MIYIDTRKRKAVCDDNPHFFTLYQFGYPEVVGSGFSRPASLRTGLFNPCQVGRPC